MYILRGSALDELWPRVLDGAMNSRRIIAELQARYGE